MGAFLCSLSCIGDEQYLPCENLCSISTAITPAMFSHSLTAQRHEGFLYSFMAFLCHSGKVLRECILAVLLYQRDGQFRIIVA